MIGGKFVSPPGGYPLARYSPGNSREIEARDNTPGMAADVGRAQAPAPLRRVPNRLRGVPIEAVTVEVAAMLQAIVRERPGLLGALLETGHGRLVIELPMRDWEWGYYSADLKTTGVVPGSDRA